MQKIGPDLFASFESDAEARFVAKLARVVRDAVPEVANEPEPAFSAQIRLLIDEARSFGLRAEQSIGVFAVTAGMLGTNFVDEHAGAKEILTSNETEFRKADLLEAWTIQLFRALDG